MDIIYDKLQNIRQSLTFEQLDEAYGLLLSLRCDDVSDIETIQEVIDAIYELTDIEENNVFYLRLLKKWLFCLYEKSDISEIESDSVYALFALMHNSPFEADIYYNLTFSSETINTAIHHYYSRMWTFRSQWIESSSPTPKQNEISEWLKSDNYQLVSWALDALERNCSARQFSDIIQLFIETRYHLSKDLFFISPEKLQFLHIPHLLDRYESDYDKDISLYIYLINKTERLIEKYIFRFPDLATAKVTDYIFEAPYIAYILRHFLYSEEEKYFKYIGQVIKYIIEYLPQQKANPSPFEQKIGASGKKSYYTVLSSLIEDLLDSNKIFYSLFEELHALKKPSPHKIYLNDKILIDYLQSPDAEVRYAAKFFIAFLPAWVKNILPRQIFDLFNKDNEFIFDDLIWLCLAKSANFSGFLDFLKIKYNWKHWIYILPKEYALNNKDKMWQIYTDVKKYTLTEPKTNFLIRSPYDWQESEENYFWNGDYGIGYIFSQKIHQIKRTIKKIIKR